MDYAQRVVAGDIVACKWVKAACQRQIDDLERSETDPDYQFVFVPERAGRVIKFIELLRHVKGKWAGQRLVLHASQKFSLACVFGWIRKADGLRRFRTVYEEEPRKNAKALALDTPVATPQGFRALRDIGIGDMVFDINGDPTRVVAESPVFIGRRCFEVRFSTGERVVCDADHLWTVRSRKTGNRGGTGASCRGMTRAEIQAQPREHVRTTDEIANTLRTGARGDTNHFVRVAGALRLPDQVLSIDPYTLGVWLGDGHTAQARFTFVDQEIVDRIVTLEGEVRKVGNGNGIPTAYLRAGHAQRLELLRGLMDTDGTVTPRGQCVFVSTKRRLAEDVVELIASLGGKPTIRETVAKIGVRVIGPAWLVQFWPDPSEPPFHLTRKRARVRQGDKMPRRHYRGIVDVREVPSVPTKCIAVESESHQFLIHRSLIPTHNTTKLAAVGLYMLTADDEWGAEVYSAATTRDQARIVWRIAKRMAAMDGLFRARFGVDVLAHSICLPHDDSLFSPLSSEGSTLDGLNVSCALIDELHAHKTRDVYDVLDSGTGSRLQPLIWAITTAGSNRAGVCYEQRTYVTRILNATLRRHGGMGYKVQGDAIEDDSTWGIIHTIDDGDDPLDPMTWQKANPLYGVSVIPEDMQRLATGAAASVAKLQGFLTKRLNVWVNADAAWMDMSKWDACADPESTRERFAGETAYIAIDAAFIKDFFAQIAIIKRGKKYHAFGRYYVPAAAIEREGWEQVRAWAAQGRITTTPGDVLDIERPKADLLADLATWRVPEVAFDPFQLTSFSVEMIREGAPMVDMRAIVKNFSEPMKELEKLVAAGDFVHDGDPVLGWMVSNVVCHVDVKENIYPRKASRDAKIDGAVALIMAIGRAMSGGGLSSDVFEALMGA